MGELSPRILLEISRNRKKISDIVKPLFKGTKPR